MERLVLLYDCGGYLNRASIVMNTTLVTEADVEIEDEKKAGYSERLFSGGLRAWLHNARFNWVRREVADTDISTDTVLELGCFDGRVLGYIPSKIENYFGYDADWEGGLSAAQSLHADRPHLKFRKCQTPEQFAGDCNNVDLFISLETMEHIPPEMLSDYIDRVKRAMAHGGTLLVSVPNEKGIVFAAKQLVKLLFLERGGKYPYSFKEFFFATIGQLEKVERGEHKGFDWEVLRAELEQSFVLEGCSGLQLPILGPYLNASIGLRFRNER